MGARIGGFDTTDIIGVGDTTPPVHFPFEITVTNTQADGLYATIRPGTVNRLLPANIFQKFYLSAGVFYVKLQCQTDGKAPTYVSIFLDSNAGSNDSPSGRSTPPVVFSLVLGVIVVESNSGGGLSPTVLQVVYNNLFFYPSVLFVETKIPTTPGEEPFTRWWGWAAS